jgi:signal transduction histidine kinase
LGRDTLIPQFRVSYIQRKFEGVGEREFEAHGLSGRLGAISKRAIRHLAASPARTIAVSLVLVLLVCLADLDTGYEFTLSILYLIPIFLTTWMVGFPAGVFMSIASTVAWFFMDIFAGHEYSHAFYRYWEALIKLTIFVVFGAMLSRLKLALERSDERLQQQRERMEATAKLVAVGEIASMLAHQLNQPLSAVVNYNKSGLRRLRSGNWEPETLVEIMEHASQEAARAAAIIQRVREFVRKRAPSRSPTEVNTMVENTLALMRGEAAKHDVHFEFEPADGLPRVYADRIMVEQVIMNLVKNGIEAMKDTPGGDRELRVLTRLNDASFVCISVSDRGQGIPADFADQLFQPFFTTKPEGMGLGLSICRSIVEFHGGTLWAAANPDAGSTFHFTLPVCE